MMNKRNKPRREESGLDSQRDGMGFAGDPPEGGTVISRGVVFNGDVESDGQGDVRVDGRVAGNIVLKQGRCLIGSHGEVTGDVSAKEIIVDGSVDGNIKGEDSVVLSDLAYVVGNVSAPSVHFSGQCQMDGKIHTIRDKPRKDGEAAPSGQAAQSKPPADSFAPDKKKAVGGGALA